MTYEPVTNELTHVQLEFLGREGTENIFGDVMAKTFLNLI